MKIYQALHPSIVRFRRNALAGIFAFLTASTLFAQSTAAPSVVAIKAPAGSYALDLRHANMSFSVVHLGMSNYVMRFTRYRATLNLDPNNLASSSVAVNIDPTSIRTDFPANYAATSGYPKFQSWDDEIARRDRFLNADIFPTIEFNSTRVESTSNGNLVVTGNFTLLGQTHPVTLEVNLVGSSATHPMTGNGGILGFSASGHFNRSTYGMTQLLKPPIVSDEVTLHFEGEFSQVQPNSATTTQIGTTGTR